MLTKRFYPINESLIEILFSNKYLFKSFLFHDIIS